MFLAITDWLLPIGFGLLLGMLIATRKNVDHSQLIYLEEEDFAKNMRKGQLIDIRKDAPFAEGHISGSRHFPDRSVFQNLHKLRTDQAVFLVGTGKRNPDYGIAVKLFKKGYHPIYILKGGMENWSLPTKKE